MRQSHGVAAGVLLAASLLVAPASAQSILGGVLGESDSLVTLNQGSAQSSGTVNLGIGGGGGNVLDVDLLPGSGGSAAAANVSTGGGSALDADIRLLNNNARVNATVGGTGLATIGVGVGGADDPGGPGGPGGPGTPGLPGASGVNGGASATGLASACAGQDASALAQLIARTNYSQNDLNRWQSSTGVEIVPVRFCADLMNQLRSLAMAGNLGFAQNVLASDALLSAALSRSGKGVNDILAVDYGNRMLTVYVR